MAEPMMFVRDATVHDAESCAAIYAPFVTDTAISFELEPPTVGEMAARIHSASRTHAWLVLQDEQGIAGYAYGGPYKTRGAYRWSCEVSVYLNSDRHRRGGGRALYETLFARLADRGYRTAVAGMTLPNPASVAFHLSMGFEPVGTYRRIGWKHGRWYDVAWTQRSLGALDQPSDAMPAEPR